jgi:hypothetical protein
MGGVGGGGVGGEEVGGLAGWEGCRCVVDHIGFAGALVLFVGEEAVVPGGEALVAFVEEAAVVA